MKEMKCTRTAAIILSLVMIFTFVPFTKSQNAYAIEIKKDVYLELNGYQTQYAGPDAAAAYYFIKECIDNQIVRGQGYYTQSHELDFYTVNLDGTGTDYDIKVTPEFEGQDKVVGLTLEKLESSNLNDIVTKELDKAQYSKYENPGEAEIYGLSYFYSRVHFDLKSDYIELRNSEWIYLYDGSQTFQDMEGQAIHKTLELMAGKGIIGKSTTVNRNGAYETEFDLDNDTVNDIKESYRVDRTSNTISRLSGYSPTDDEYTVSATSELASEMLYMTVLQLKGIDHLYQSLVFNMMEPQILPPPPVIIILDGVEVKLSKTSFTYNGKVQKPEVKTIGGAELTEGTDYTAEWSNASSRNAGSYKVTIRGIGNYEGETSAVYKINKAANPLSIKAKTAAVKAKKLKKQAVKLDAAKVINFVNKGKGKLSFVKKTGSKKILINKKNGKVTIKKGLKKGKYKIKVQVKAAGGANYKASSFKTVTFKIRVK